ncbi:hypothetical protein IE81DRAFT_349080 [Ceraceosorus guamensis]|uniref:Uncharacterized protein n=1 Tax=Ceraceosorus guamensis TaxID=1522189 RepID=A0A316VT96_9BASI|nr:hypothetical protein IE81DRAFT_349080 [Ceraceosorus guamensis]PWN40600.1 hypothetical protein IE81DRAFT_349080 [Ceraceosorus guamensis]
MSLAPSNDQKKVKVTFQGHDWRSTMELSSDEALAVWNFIHNRRRLMGSSAAPTSSAGLGVLAIEAGPLPSVPLPTHPGPARPAFTSAASTLPHASKECASSSAHPKPKPLKRTDASRAHMTKKQRKAQKLIAQSLSSAWRVTPSPSNPLFTAMSASSGAPEIELCKLSLTGSRLELRVELTVQQAWDAISFMRQGYPPQRPQDSANTYRASLCGSTIRLESQLTAKEASALVLHLGRTLLAPVPTRDLSTDVPLVNAFHDCETPRSLALSPLSEGRLDVTVEDDALEVVGQVRTSTDPLAATQRNASIHSLSSRLDPNETASSALRPSASLREANRVAFSLQEQRQARELRERTSSIRNTLSPTFSSNLSAVASHASGRTEGLRSPTSFGNGSRLSRSTASGRSNFGFSSADQPSSSRLLHRLFTPIPSPSSRFSARK